MCAAGILVGLGGLLLDKARHGIREWGRGSWNRLFENNETMRRDQKSGGKKNKAGAGNLISSGLESRFSFSRVRKGW